ncbi:MAG TPA: hypothetical protein VFE62_29120 [Gemmataceae bacterium]|nr:hypothetical protein [Gemmataceae bacterium]
MRLTGLLLATLVTSLTFIPSADAQIWRWFGPKSDKNAPVKSGQPDPRRLAEINVEVAWLADPITFPYYLEAHANAGKVEVRGYVPNKAVREQALRIAQVYSSLPVVDAIKEHPSLLVRPGQLSAQQLQSTAQSSLRVALPRQYQNLKIECDRDGKVFVLGPVSTIEEKVAVSHSLRRLHGCTSVQNLTTLPAEITQSTERAPIVKTSNPGEPRDKPGVGPEVKPRSWLIWPFTRTASKEEPTAPPETKEPTPIAVKDPVEPMALPKIPAPTLIAEIVKAEAPAKTKLSAADLRKRIQAACREAKSVDVQFTSATEVRITLEIRNDRDLEPAAQKVYSMPELQDYRPDLQFKISMP